MEGHCSTGQSPQWAVVPMEEEEEELYNVHIFLTHTAGLFKSVSILHKM
jgi:hypothetical protein